MTRVVRLTAWNLHLPYAEGTYRMSGDRISTGMDSVIVRLTAEDGTVGFGESGSVGVTYDAVYNAGQVTGLGVIAAAIVGADARNPKALFRRMHTALTGHGYVKAPADIAAWDLAARLAGVPLWQYVGGDEAGRTPLYRPVQGATPELSVAKARERITQGYPRLQVKVGDDPRMDAQRVLAVREAVGADVAIYADANCNFTLASARVFARELGADGAGVYMEQPCATIADCARLRDSWAGPMVLDESIVSLEALLDSHRLGAADGVTVKLTRVGGATPALLLRDVAVSLGIHVTVDDAGGGALGQMAFAHLNGSTPERFRVHTVDFGGWTTLSNAIGPESRDGDSLVPSSTAGTGTDVDESVLPEAFLDVRL